MKVCNRCGIEKGLDLSDTEQQKQCFHYTNLQPLWAKENLSKSDKYEKDCRIELQ